MQRKKQYIILLLIGLLVIQLNSGCQANSNRATKNEKNSSSETTDNSKIATSSEMVTPENVITDDMVPITGDKIKDGEYDVVVDSSSSMFKIRSCKLKVENGKMTAEMTMDGKGYLYVYIGTGKEAVKASKDTYIAYKELESGEHTYTVPVEALDSGINCAAYSKKKEKWYERILVFRSDSLPDNAFRERVLDKGDDLKLEDGEYNVNVTLEGGSGRASIQSPTKVTVKEGKVYATIVWSSNNYDYMIVDGKKYLNDNKDHNTGDSAIFKIPVLGFNYKMPVIANTTAMSTPHEIEYTLCFELVK